MANSPANNSDEGKDDKRKTSVKLEVAKALVRDPEPEPPATQASKPLLRHGEPNASKSHDHGVQRQEDAEDSNHAVIELPHRKAHIIVDGDKSLVAAPVLSPRENVGVDENSSAQKKSGDPGKVKTSKKAHVSDNEGPCMYSTIVFPQK